MIGEANAGSLGNVVIRVSPEILSQKSEAALDRIRSIQTHIEKVESAVNRSRSYWTGDAAESYRRAYNEFREELQEAVKRFEENATDLQTIAANYQQIESQSQTAAEELPMDVIE